MTSEAPIHEHADYSNDTRGVGRRTHSYSASTTNLLTDSDSTLPAREISDSYYQRYGDPNNAYDAYKDTRYFSDQSTDSFKGKPDMPFTPPLDKSANFRNLDYAEPFSAPHAPSQLASEKTPNMLERYFGLYPLQQRIADKKRGVGVQRYAIVVWLLTAAMFGVLIYELVVNARAQGTPFSFKPTVNPMLGPSGSALINVGARFPPCMKTVEDIPLSTTLPCLNDTANPPDRMCSLESLCGFGGFHHEAPDQTFRFFTPIFLHAGLVHYALNMLAQMTVSAQVEREMGSMTFLILYIASGIFGNVLGGNFALVGVPSVGASGAIFGTTAVAWVDLFAHWRYTYRPGRRLAWMLVELIIGIAMGFIPYVDNFAHLGGLLMGLLVGMMFYPIISPSTRHRSIVIGFRIAAIPAAILLFVFLTRNFYTSNPYAACAWCRYLSCIPTSANDHCKGTGLTSTTTSF